jgi:hypothetical protein
MSNTKLLRVVEPVVEPEPVANPAPAVGRFVSFEEMAAVRILLVEGLGHFEDTCTEPDPVARIGNGCRRVRAAIKRLL